ncbi:MAG: DUF3326 domain-containing protein, partial [Synechococcaceae cyanobacterium ELA182]
PITDRVIQMVDENRRYWTPMLEITRGCPRNCSFCTAIRVSGQRMRLRPVDEVVDEIQRRGIKRFFLTDDNFGLAFRTDPDYIEALFHALAPLPLDPDLDPRAAAEELGHTFLPCVLVGLSRAPDLVPVAHDRMAPAGTLLTAAALGAVVAPAGAMGGEAVLACAERGVPVIAVHNPCLLQVTGEALGLEVLPAASYAEAAGLVLALREGIDPVALQRPLPALAELSLGSAGLSAPAGPTAPGAG